MMPRVNFSEEMNIYRSLNPRVPFTHTKSRNTFRFSLPKAGYPRFPSFADED